MATKSGLIVKYKFKEAYMAPTFFFVARGVYIHIAYNIWSYLCTCI
jgi:hypothetical protein